MHESVPALRFELPQRKKTRVNIEFHERLYSVPFKLRQEVIEVRATPSVVECFQPTIVANASGQRPVESIVNAAGSR